MSFLLPNDIIMCSWLQREHTALGQLSYYQSCDVIGHMSCACCDRENVLFAVGGSWISAERAGCKQQGVDGPQVSLWGLHQRAEGKTGNSRGSESSFLRSSDLMLSQTQLMSSWNYQQGFFQRGGVEGSICSPLALACPSLGWKKPWSVLRQIPVLK